MGGIGALQVLVRLKKHVVSAADRQPKFNF